MKKTLLAFFMFSLSLTFISCNNNSIIGGDDFVSRLENLGDKAVDEGPDWDLDEWTDFMIEYAELRKEFYESEPTIEESRDFSDEQLEFFNKIRSLDEDVYNIYCDALLDSKYKRILDESYDLEHKLKKNREEE